MDNTAERLSKIEAVQHFSLGILSGVVATLHKTHPEITALIAQHLEQHHAQMLAMSVDEVKMAAFQELRQSLAPYEGTSP